MQKTSLTFFLWICATFCTWNGHLSNSPCFAQESTNPNASSAETSAGESSGDDEETKADDQATTGDNRPSDADESPSHEAEGPKRQAFDVQFEEWKTLLSDLRDIRLQYENLAEDAELDDLRKQWMDGIQRGNDMVPKLRDSAMAAFREAPNSDRELSRFVVKMAADLVRQDNYIPAKTMLIQLRDLECDERGIDNLLGIAASGTNDFALATECFTNAQRDGSLSEQGTELFGSINVVTERWDREVQLRKAELEQEDPLPRVLLETTAGDITLILFENEAPETVGNFVSLVEKGYYDGLNFHRVLPGFMAQGGCPKGDGTGSPGYSVYCECINEDHRDHFAGSLSMAKGPARHSGGSQFFITFQPRPNLDGQHTVFGYVIEGMEVLPKITKVDPENTKSNGVPTVIEKATVLNKRDHEYRPSKVK